MDSDLRRLSPDSHLKPEALRLRGYNPKRSTSKHKKKTTRKENQMHKTTAWVAVAVTGLMFCGAFSSAAKATSFTSGSGSFVSRSSNQETDYQPVFGADECTFSLYRRAIIAIESGGNPNAQGVVTDANGSRAQGRFQVMSFNVGPWTKKHLGESYSPARFRSDPRAQEIVFKNESLEYYAKYGSWDHAASKWFSGQPYSARNAQSSDANGTSVQGYVHRVRKYMRMHAGECSSQNNAPAERGRMTNAEAWSLPGMGIAAQKALETHCRKYGCPRGGVNKAGARYAVNSNGGTYHFTAELHSNCSDGSSRCPHTGMTAIRVP
jgi:hypothetical protein